MHIVTHLVTKSVSCRSAKFTTGDFESIVYVPKEVDTSIRAILFFETLIKGTYGRWCVALFRKVFSRECNFKVRRWYFQGDNERMIDGDIKYLNDTFWK